jgi:CheY-like chemotaxis protein
LTGAPGASVDGDAVVEAVPEVLGATAPTAALGAASAIGPLDVVVAAWDVHHPIGGAVYRWALIHRFDLRDRFVFLADEVTADFDAVVAGRCLLVPTSALAELIAVVESTARRLRGSAAAGGSYTVPGPGPRVLVVDDDPVLLAAMVDVLSARGYAVTAAAAISAGEVLARESFDAFVIDVGVAGGVAALVARAGRNASALVEKVVLVTNGPPPVAERPLGRPIFAKGDDAGLLLGALARIAPRRA